MESLCGGTGAATYDTELAPDGRPSKPRHGEIFRRTFTDLMSERYADFGPTLAAEKPAGTYGLRVGVETMP